MDKTVGTLGVLKKQQGALVAIFSGNLEGYSGEQVSLMSEVRERVDAVVSLVEKSGDAERFLPFAMVTKCCMTEFARLQLNKDLVSANKRLFERAVRAVH